MKDIFVDSGLTDDLAIAKAEHEYDQQEQTSH